MKFKVGEKVKFLNERGGGIVTAIVDSRLVKVETYDGFEMPVLTSELIKDFRAEEVSAISDLRIPVKETPAEETSDTFEEDSFISELNPYGTIKEEKGIYLSYTPHDQQWVLTGDIDIYLINHTPFEILFNLYLKTGSHLKGVDYGSVPAKSKYLLSTIDREEIENWTNGFIQFLIHHDQPARVFLPVHAVISYKAGRFFKEGSYQPNTLQNEKAVLTSLAPESTFETATGSEEEQKVGRVISETKTDTKTTEKAPVDKHRTNMFEALVDLHIGELVDNITGLSNHDMFNVQMAYFRKMLESALRNDYRKITFIHGVGNGILKNAIVKEIEEYEGLENKMASISKFGVGAIDILIKSINDYE